MPVVKHDPTLEHRLGVWSVQSDPAAYVADMNQLATYFPPGSADVFGETGFTEAPVLIRCRWQDEAVVFRSAEGQEMTSSSVVYVDRKLEPHGYLVLGDATEAAGPPYEPASIEGAGEIRQRAASPSLSATQVLHKVYL